jgi:Domain of unknown function (DUF4743)
MPYDQIRSIPDTPISISISIQHLHRSFGLPDMRTVTPFVVLITAPHLVMFRASRRLVQAFNFRDHSVGRRFSERRLLVCNVDTNVEIQHMQNILARVRNMNYMPDDIRSSLLDFRVDGITLGKVRPRNADLLCSIPSDVGPVFCLRGGNGIGPGDESASKPYLTLTDACGDTYESRTAAVSTVTQILRETNVVTGWRDELFPIAQSFYEPPVFAMERAAVPYLGALEYGVHMIGLVRPPTDPSTSPATKSVQMWMARRSATKSKYPGMLDHIAAGGQPLGLSLTENVVKECWEEAGIPPEISRAAMRPAGAVSYMRYAANKDVVVR